MAAPFCRMHPGCIAPPSAHRSCVSASAGSLRDALSCAVGTQSTRVCTGAGCTYRHTVLNRYVAVDVPLPLKNDTPKAGKGKKGKSKKKT